MKGLETVCLLLLCWLVYLAGGISGRADLRKDVGASIRWMVIGAGAVATILIWRL